METLQPIRFEEARPVVVTGLSEQYASDKRDGFDEQWGRFWEQIGETTLPREALDMYGVTYDMDQDGTFQYLCGVPLPDGFTPPAGWSLVEIPNRRYAVFGDWGDMSRIKDTYNQIFGEWLPGSPYALAAAPVFELYGEQFDPATGLGIEIWVPVTGG